jgi:hypothetical protein
MTSRITVVAGGGIGAPIRHDALDAPAGAHLRSTGNTLGRRPPAERQNLEGAAR